MDRKIIIWIFLQCFSLDPYFWIVLVVTNDIKYMVDLVTYAKSHGVAFTVVDMQFDMIQNTGVQSQ